MWWTWLITLALILNPRLMVKGKMVVVHDRYEACEGQENRPIKLVKASVGQVARGEHVLNSEVIIERKIDRMVTGDLQLVKCLDRTMAACEKYIGGKVGNACPIMLEKNKPWSGYFNVSPPLSCPFQPGKYLSINATSRTDSLVKYIHDPNSYYRLTFKVLEKQVEIYCVHMSFYVQTSRSKG